MYYIAEKLANEQRYSEKQYNKSKYLRQGIPGKRNTRYGGGHVKSSRPYKRAGEKLLFLLRYKRPTGSFSDVRVTACFSAY